MILAGLAAAAAALLWLDDAPRARLPAPDARGAAPRGRPAWLTAPWFAGLLAAVGVSRVVDGAVGLLVGTTVGAVVAWWVSRLEPAAERRRREQIASDLPLVLDLVVAATESGRSSPAVLSAVATAVGPPVSVPLAATAARLELGVDPAEAWREIVDDEVLAPLGHAFLRASRTGSHVGRTLERAADDARARRRSLAQERARSVGVRTAAPLGACFLPAFVLLGVVPIIAAAFESLSL